MGNRDLLVQKFGTRRNPPHEKTLARLTKVGLNEEFERRICQEHLRCYNLRLIDSLFKKFGPGCLNPAWPIAEFKFKGYHSWDSVAKQFLEKISDMSKPTTRTRTSILLDWSQYSGELNEEIGILVPLVLTVHSLSHFHTTQT
eukprot:TRINITY_DN5585_c0_g1_i3.p2 TRINITY_DN5585_c0_g1~~TRINITY_DN5585_c0_g1_i3.p2  ORF type:complete len:143 (+),score=18.54 TRINITY_DN5585_c0_g1_i3:84-512(+)